MKFRIPSINETLLYHARLNLLLSTELLGFARRGELSWRESFAVLQEVAMSEGDPPVSTGSGDDGTTNLLGAGRLAKDDVRVALLGDVDEASASLVIARSEAEDGEVEELLL
jgi:hypothetical protein